MSEIRLLVREAERDWSGKVPGSWADSLIAALSADAVTIDELKAAIARFDRCLSSSDEFICSLKPGSCDEPHDAGLIVIDLIARLVVIDSTYSSPGPNGSIVYCDEHGKERAMQYHLANDWHFVYDSDNWHGLAQQRRRQRTASPPLDARTVFYGRPMIEYVARETFAAAARRDEIESAVRLEWIARAREWLAEEKNISPAEVTAESLTEEEIMPKTRPGSERYASPFYNTLKEIHANWLVTPREDLRGQSPREIMFKRRNHISNDLDDRCREWSLLGQCPPGLDESSHAFRFAGFGIHETVEYYELVRELLWSCWERLGEMSHSHNMADRPESMTVSDFLAGEIPRLEQVRDCWLDTPDPELDNRTPGAVINRERARLPEGVSGQDAVIDADCPCCQKMAESGPYFMHLNGCNMDDEFAFDLYCHSREQWEVEQRQWDE